MTYEEFLNNVVDLPTKEEFDKALSELPPFINTKICDDFYIGCDDLYKDDLYEYLLENGILYKFDVALNSLDLNHKSINLNAVYGFKNDIIDLNNYLNSHGWTIENFDDIIEMLDEEDNEQLSFDIFNKLRDLDESKLNLVLNFINDL